MFRRVSIVVLAAVLIAVVGLYSMSSHSALAPVKQLGVRAFPEDQIVRGEVLAGAANCAICHTGKSGQLFAGGVPFNTKFGVVYSTNITPDPTTGIGEWSEAAFARALREGVARDGSQLFPVFPYDHFTKVNDEDVKAMYAFIMTRPALVREPESNQLAFPLNIRALQIGWKLLFFHPGVFQADTTQTSQWNRGSYLAEGLGHCSACHTPRNSFGAENVSAKYNGASIEGWFAPALNLNNSAPLPWTSTELYGYLRTGGTVFHGSAAGVMSDIVHNGLVKLSDEDLHAMANYFAAINGSGDTVAESTKIISALNITSEHDAQATDPGAKIYRAACASCHYNQGLLHIERPELALNNALTAPSPANFIQVVLHGIGRDEGLPELMMPGYAAALSDAEIADLAVYLRRTRTAQPAWSGVEAAVAAIRTTGDGT